MGAKIENMKTRIKSTSSLTRQDAERTVARIAEITNLKRQLTAEDDAAILKIRERHAAQIDAINAEIKTTTALVQAWAEANHHEFGNRRSLEFPAGKIGFRTGTPKLKTLSGWTFARVLESLTSLPWGRAFVRVKEEIDKEGLLAAHSAAALAPAQLREIGCRVDQDETFFIEPDLTPIGDSLTTQKAEKPKR